MPILRRVIAGLLVVLTSVSALGAAFGMWVRDNVFDTGSFASKGTEIVQQPEVADSISRHLTDQVLVTLKDAAMFPGSGRIVELARPGAERRVSKALRSESFRGILEPALVQTHRELIRSIKGDQDAVRLNLLPLVAQILDELKRDGVVPGWVKVPRIRIDQERGEQALVLSRALRVPIPADFGQVTLIGPHPPIEVRMARSAIRVIDDIVAWTFAAAVTLAIVAVAVSDRRGWTIAALGVGSALAWVGGLVTVSFALSSVAASAPVRDEAAVRAALKVFFASWTALSGRLIVLGLLVGGVGTAVGILTKPKRTLPES